MSISLPFARLRSIDPQRQYQEIEALRERLWVGLRLFHAGQDGQRERAVRHFLHVLADPLRIPGFRLAAACLVAEMYRGVERPEDAVPYYRVAIEEAAGILQDEQLQNEWWCHYLPRAQLGLFMAERQLLTTKPGRLRELLYYARQRLSLVGGDDFGPLLTALEGLHSRQLGDYEGAIDLLHRAHQGLAPLAPPFLLLFPEHIEALFAQALLLTPASHVQSGRLARGLLSRVNVGPWAQAVACGVLLHGTLAQVFDTSAPAARARQLLDDSGTAGAAALLSQMEEATIKERDPALITEHRALRAAWLLAAQDPEAETAVTALHQLTRVQRAPLQLLRGVEIMVAWQRAGSPQHLVAVLQPLVNLASAALNELGPSLGEWGVTTQEHELWKGWLTVLASDGTVTPTGWFDGALNSLRARLWP